MPPDFTGASYLQNVVGAAGRTLGRVCRRLAVTSRGIGWSGGEEGRLGDAGEVCHRGTGRTDFDDPDDGV